MRSQEARSATMRSIVAARRRHRRQERGSVSPSRISSGGPDVGCDDDPAWAIASKGFNGVTISVNRTLKRG
jgi:hypothetical protein